MPAAADERGCWARLAPAPFYMIKQPGRLMTGRAPVDIPKYIAFACWSGERVELWAIGHEI